MSNLLKSSNYSMSGVTETKVIDYNSVISEKIAKLQNEVRQDNFIANNNGFVEGLKVEKAIDLVSDEEIEDTRIIAEEIIASANSEAQTILARAREEADILKEESANCGREEGYRVGMEQAQVENRQMKQELEQMRQELEEEYNMKLKGMESLLVDAILKVFSEVTHVLSEDDGAIVLALVNDVLTKAEVSKEFLIKVSPDDYPYMLENRENIIGAVSKKVQIEIVEEPSFTKNQCVIESDSGIFDCSLDVQMNNLIKTIKTLSCMVE